MEQDGSSTGFLYLDEVGAPLDKGRAYLRLGAGHDQILNRMLRARVGKGRNLYLQGTEDVVQFLPGEPHISMGDGVLSLTMPKFWRKYAMFLHLIRARIHCLIIR